MNLSIHTYLLRYGQITEQQLIRAEELARVWQGTLPVVLLKLGLINLATFALLFELDP